LLQLQAQLQDMQALVQQQQQQVPGSSAGAAAAGPRLMQAATSMPTAYSEPFETQIPNYLGRWRQHSRGRRRPQHGHSSSAVRVSNKPDAAGKIAQTAINTAAALLPQAPASTLVISCHVNHHLCLWLCAHKRTVVIDHYIAKVVCYLPSDG
jgi:hypothetical protein